MGGSFQSIVSHDGDSFDVYVSAPPTGPAPGIVLMQYICGVNQYMQDLADHFAAQGYAVACPDLFWRQERRVQLNDDPANPSPEDFQKALAFNDGFDDAHAAKDLRSTVDFLRGADICDGTVGAVGYCLGGRLAYLVAARTDVDCAVGYYGVNIDTYLDEADRITAPLMLHFAGEDALCSGEARDKIIARLDSVPGAVTHVYPGVNHAFALVGGQTHDKAAADLADARTLAFLEQHLKDGANA